MSRTPFVLAPFALSALLGAACKKHDVPSASSVAPVASTAAFVVASAPVASAPATPPPVAAATAVPTPSSSVAAAYARLSDEDLAVPEDFQEETKKTIDQKNYKKELDKLEKELAAPED
jgi:hypothetical protein